MKDVLSGLITGAAMLAFFLLGIWAGSGQRTATAHGDGDPWSIWRKRWAGITVSLVVTLATYLVTYKVVGVSLPLLLIGTLFISLSMLLTPAVQER